MPACVTCHQRPPRVCDECLRAVAMQWWGGIARHDQGATCVLCERGEALYCAEDFFDAVTERRAWLREIDMPIGEPRRRAVMSEVSAVAL